MTENIDALLIREARDGDENAIVELFTEQGGNPYGWNAEKWRHYYRDYPEGRPVALVAELDGKVVGHYGMLPIRLGRWSAMLGLHAYVTTAYRGLNVISALMREVDVRCTELGVAAICGFANPKFSMVKKTFFKWRLPVWLGFKSGLDRFDVDAGGEKFRFVYSPAWYAWRFQEDRGVYISRYTAPDGQIRKQLLKLKPDATPPDDATLACCEGWSRRAMFSVEQKDRFCQPFAVKAFSQDVIDEGIYESQNWFLEMGDSDTFQYSPWSST